MKTKIFLSIITLVFFQGSISAQIFKNLEKRVERKVNQRINRATDRTIDKGLDKVENRIKNTGASASETASGNSVSSKFDFVAGEKILFSDHFENASTGDFPKKWNTNGGGEVVVLEKHPEKWLRIPDNTITFPELKNKLPENFTVEFDLLYPEAGQRPPVTLGFSEVANPAKNSVQHKKIFYFLIPPSVKQWVGYSTSLYSGRETTQEWAVERMVNRKIRVSIAVNGPRIRLYLGEKKIFDLPKAFSETGYRNNFHFRAAPLIPQPKEGFFITQIRIAEVINPN